MNDIIKKSLWHWYSTGLEKKLQRNCPYLFDFRLLREDRADFLSFELFRNDINEINIQNVFVFASAGRGKTIFSIELAIKEISNGLYLYCEICS